MITLWSLFVYLGSCIINIICSAIVVFHLILKFLKHGRKYYEFQHKPTKTPLSLVDLSKISGFVHLRKQGIRLHYVISGDQSGPMILMIHGFPDFWFSWRHQIPAFVDYCIVAIDMRGYGYSDKPTSLEEYSIDKLLEDIEELISIFGRSSAIIIGHNWGGIIAWLFAAKYPDSVDRLIVLNAPHPLCFKENIFYNFKSKWFLFFFQQVNLPEYFLSTGRLEKIVEIFKNNGRNKCICEEIEAYKYMFSDPKTFTAPLNYFRQNFLRILEMKEEDLANIIAPTLIIWGDGDFFQHFVCPFHSMRYCNKWRIRIIRDVGHWAHHEEPEIVNSCIRDFLNTDVSVLS